ncbi:MAG: hypothetical protein R3360_06120, partial [Alphaproteobacteria bacterium]|nr:hypothetical protein [Alphaproteobacteria bacterium]
MTEAVHGIGRHAAVRALEMTDKGHAKDLPTEVVAQKGDHFEIGGIMLGNDGAQIVDQAAVAHLKTHDYGGAQGLWASGCANVAGDKLTQRLGALLHIHALLGLLDLGEKQVGLKAQQGEFVGSLDQFAAGLDQRLAISGVVINRHQPLTGTEQ